MKKIQITKIHRRPSPEGMKLWCYLNKKLMLLSDAQEIEEYFVAEAKKNLTSGVVSVN